MTAEEFARHAIRAEGSGAFFDNAIKGRDVASSDKVQRWTAWLVEAFVKHMKADKVPADTLRPNLRNPFERDA